MLPEINRNYLNDKENEEVNPSFNTMNNGFANIKSYIQKNHANSILKVCSKENISEKNAIILKVHLSRATLDNVKIFNEFLSAELHLVYNHYIIDLSESHFMDSTFLGSIVRLFKNVRRTGGNLSLVVNFDQIKILAPFEQLQKILKVYSTIEEAKLNI